MKGRKERHFVDMTEGVDRYGNDQVVPVEMMHRCPETSLSKGIPGNVSNVKRIRNEKNLTRLEHGIQRQKSE